MRGSRFITSFGILAVALCQAQAPATDKLAAGSSPTSRVCQVTASAPTPGDNQLATNDYKTAEATFRAALASDASSDEAHLGLTRALIGEDRVIDAQAEASALLRDHPKSAIAEVAVAEAGYRAGELATAFSHAQAGLKDNPCEARILAVYAALLDLNGYCATEAHYLQQAHRLRPNDEIIRREWIQSLPRKERQEELSRYLEGQHALSTDESRGYANELAHLKARRTGECRVTSKAETTTIPLQSIFGDNTTPVAFGLDVSFNNTRRRMQIDTGASGIVLTKGAARALKLTPEYTIKTGGIGDEGDRDSYLAHVQTIRIGDVEVSDCMVEVVNKSKLDVDGLIGMDVFNRWLVTLDYAAAQLTLAPLPPRPSPATANATETKAALDDTGDEGTPKDRYIAPEMKDWGRILRIGHEILLPAFFQKENSPTHYLLMDTGASVTSLSSTMAKESGKLHGSDTEFVGLSGKVNKVYEIDATSLIVNNIVLPRSGYYAYDMTGISHDSGFEVSGLLGLPTLQRLTIKIDYRDNLLKLSYDPKHDIIRFHTGSN